jgi:hypothetical protein
LFLFKRKKKAAKELENCLKIGNQQSQLYESESLVTCSSDKMQSDKYFEKKAFLTKIDLDYVPGLDFINTYRMLCNLDSELNLLFFFTMIELKFNKIQQKVNMN